MPNIKSAVKRVQIAERNRLRNKAYKSSVRTLMKKFFAALDTYAASQSPEAKQEVQTLMSDTYSRIDKAVKRGVFHSNNGARKKARLTKALKKVEAPVSTAS
uniref:30S ribosomal protein S20 n=1 Tax=Desertifilum tharense IPPAS B-1220 TaxID=1781255 RepID=A0ACD5H1M6_9CYAN